MTGVLGPGSNPHGPNESLDLPFFKKLTCGISYVVSQHHTFEQEASKIVEEAKKQPHTG